MDLISLLVAQHREVETLFFKVDAAEGEERKETFLELARKLTLHARLEEELVYPALRVASTQDFLHDSLTEHAEVTRLLSQLERLRPEDREFDAKLVLLRASVDAHVAEEQAVLFPQVGALLDDAALADLTARVELRLEELSAPGALPTVSASSELWA